MASSTTAAAKAVSTLARRIASTGLHEAQGQQAKTFMAAAAAAPKALTLPDLAYGYGELEPVISGEIMEIHHKKHHQAYITNFNVAMGKLVEAEAKGDVSAMIALQPVGALAQAIESQFGSLAGLQDTMSAQSVAVQGSGWGWLGVDKKMKRLAIVALPNQDPLEATTGLVPLVGIDVWEHAYYLQYKNVRPDYVKAIWKVVNWKDAEARFAAAMSS
ncbi:mitochondrial manganese superoxide dismutase [Nannochloropsis oceanica]